MNGITLSQPSSLGIGPITHGVGYQSTYAHRWFVLLVRSINTRIGLLLIPILYHP